MIQQDVYAELGKFINGEKTGRTSDDEIIIFEQHRYSFAGYCRCRDVYEKALAGEWMGMDFA